MIFFCLQLCPTWLRGRRTMRSGLELGLIFAAQQVVALLRYYAQLRYPNQPVQEALWTRELSAIVPGAV